MRKFRCIKSWARDTVGDIVENYMMQRYPREIRMGHFEEIIEKPKVKEAAPMAAKPVQKKAEPAPVEKISDPNLK